MIFCHILLLLVACLQLLTSICGAHVKTNRMRYAKNRDADASSMPLEQAFEMAASTSTSNQYRPSLLRAGHTINPKDEQAGKEDNINYKSLDEEDKRLLERFYSETKKSDPFLSDSPTTENLWDDQGVSGLSALLDGEPKMAYSRDYGNRRHSSKFRHAGDWTLEPNTVHGGKKLTTEDKNVPYSEAVSDTEANYSPSLRLLTSYNPLATSSQQSVGRNIYASPRDNRLVGATLYGRDKDSKPDVKSKSAVDAVRMHDNLMKKPPRDGKVRVRMYYHRAIHDDSRLYGTGPWKYWGHGWGLEFGFDPKSEKKNKDFYQKGYTIERAFGRDFCVDKNNCRQPDPDFFKDPYNVGKYSRQHQHMARNPKSEAIKSFNTYKKL